MNQPIDLSRLNSASAPSGLSPASNQGPGDVGTDAGSVVAWLAKVDESGLRSYLELSRKLPILLLVSKAGDPAIDSFSNSLAQVIQAAQGRIAGCEVDADANPSLAQALRITSLPSLFLLLDGKPSPVADSVVPPQDLAELVRQVLGLAAQEGFSGRVRVAEAPSNPIDPRFDEAAQLLADGNLVKSAEIFEQILKDRPADREAKAGLGQVRLMQRLQQPDRLTEQERQLLPADQLFAAGDFAPCLELLLSEFASAPADSRQLIRERLVEFFGMIGDTDALVISARGRLASMLF